jgi:hypothetical protein
MADEKPDEPTQEIPAKDGDLEVPVPSRRDFLRFVDRVTGAGRRKRPDEKDPTPPRSE